ncbi:MAG: hypothetical protein E6K25_00585 [Gammaproteobacteria bacterium]|nr:MAG: hypothetical protein E6K25_00585 [Gammaproteobacteria bacterium]
MQRRHVREHRHGQRLGGGAGRAGRHAPQLHVQRPLQDGVAQLELRRTPCLQAQPPRSQRLVQLAGVRAAVGMQYIVQLASEYFGDRAQMPALAHAVDAHDVPPAIQQAMEEIRGIAMNLRPAVLDDLGAASAVSWFCREFAQSYPSLTLREAVAVVDADIPERLSTAVFRSLQELLNNVAKHAQARQVVVSLARSADQLVLEVTDDGVGLEASVSSASMRSGRGMRNLRERAEMTGGQMRLQPGAAGVGTQARIEWQLGPSEARKTDAA